MTEDDEFRRWRQREGDPGKWSDVSSGHNRRFRIPLNNCTKSDLPVRTPKSHTEDQKKPRNGADASHARTHAQSHRIDVKMTRKTAEIIRIIPKKLKPPNSPVGAV